MIASTSLLTIHPRMVSCYPSVQSTAELYEYPSKKFPPHIRNRKNPPAPTADEGCNYLQEYIDEKNMRSKFKFNTTVSEVFCTAEDTWIVEYDEFTTATFSFVILCNGLVSSKPNRVHIPGTDKFIKAGGKIIHSSERRSDDLFLHGSGRVMVIGNGKSAVDAAAAAATIAEENATQPPIQLARRQTWYVPRYLLGCLQYKWAFHTRIGSSLLPRYFESKSLLLKLLHCFFAPIKWVLWRLVEILLLMQYRLPFRLWPKLGTVEASALETSVLITDEEHLVRLRKGSIDMRIGEVERLESGKAILKNGKEEDVDVIILGTGWRLSYDRFISSDSIFAGLDFEKDYLDFQDDGLWLYRNILPAGFKGMAFVGANSLTFINVYTSYIQAYWVAQLLAGERPWPDEDHMKWTVEREKAFKRKYYKESEMRSASIEAYMQHYHDVLFHEMNARKPFNCLIRPIADLFVPVVPSLMKGCLEPLSSNTSQKEKKKQRQKKNECDNSNTASSDGFYSESPV